MSRNVRVIKIAVFVTSYRINISHHVFHDLFCHASYDILLSDFCGVLRDLDSRDVIDFLSSFIVDNRLDLDRLRDQLLNRHVNWRVGGVLKQYMVGSVRRNPMNAVKILNELYGDYDFEDTKDDYRYTAHGYLLDVLVEGLFSNENPKVTMYNIQLFNDKVTMDNIELLSNSEEIMISDKISFRYMAECIEARIAFDAGMVPRNVARREAFLTFRKDLRDHKVSGYTDEMQFRRVRQLLVDHDGVRDMGEDLLRNLTSDTGILIKMRREGNEAAHCDGMDNDIREDIFVAAVKRQPEDEQSLLEEVRVCGLNYRL